MNKYMYCALVYLVALLFTIFLNGCTGLTLKEIEVQEAKLHKQLEYWRYNAVEDGSGVILCEAGDKVCHDFLISTYLSRGHVGDIINRRTE